MATISEVLQSGSLAYTKPTPASVAARRKLAEQLMETTQIKNAGPLGALANTIGSAGSAYSNSQATQEQQRGMGEYNALLAQALSSPEMSDADLASLASNPWAGEANNPIAAALMGQAIQRRDPAYDLDLAYKQAQLDKMAAEASQQDLQPLINAGGGNLYNPNTGEWLSAPSSGEPDLTDTQRNLMWRAEQAGLQQGTPEYAQFMASGGSAGTSLTVGPDGTVQFQQGGGKPLTEGQSKDTVYSIRAGGTLPLIDQYGPALLDPVQHAMGADQTGIIRGRQTPEFQQAWQAGREFLQAILRKDTGAAITPAETEEYGKVYLPQPGDTEEVLEQKRISRGRAVIAIDAGLPPQAILAKEKALLGSDDLSQMPQGAAPSIGEVQEGYRYIGGDPANPASWEPM